MANFRDAFTSCIKMHRAAAIKYSLYGGYEALPIDEDSIDSKLLLIVTDNIETGGKLFIMDKDASEALGEDFYKAIGFSEDRKFKVPRFLVKNKLEDDEPASPKKKKVLKKRLTAKKR